jgi:flap endonuclease-1
VQSEGELSEDEPAPTSDVERPDDSDGEAKPKPKPKKKGKGKGKGGVMIPDEWPWEEAKQVFMEPDVLPADEVEVRSDISYLSCYPTCCVRSSSSGRILM